MTTHEEILMKRASLRTIKRRLKNRIANGNHGWGEINTMKAIKALEEEIRILKQSIKV